MCGLASVDVPCSCICGSFPALKPTKTAGPVAEEFPIFPSNLVDPAKVNAPVAVSAVLLRKKADESIPSSKLESAALAVAPK